MGWEGASWPGLNAGQFGLVANEGNRWTGRLEGIAVVGTCTRELWWCTGPAWCIECIRSSGCSRVKKSCRIGRRRHQPRRFRKDKPSRGSTAFPDRVPSRIGNQHRIGGRGSNRGKRSLGDSNLSSSACDQTWGFAWPRKSDSRDSLTVADSC